VVGAVQAKLPGTLALPPVRVEVERVWPAVIALAVGRAKIAGIPFTISMVRALAKSSGSVRPYSTRYPSRYVALALVFNGASFHLPGKVLRAQPPITKLVE
jgi:hypothetical protein